MTALHVKVRCRLCTNTVLPSTSRKTGGLCLDCYHSEKHRIAREARESRPGCAGCDGSTESTGLWFDWQRAEQGIGDYRKYPKYLRRVGQVKGGERYICTECGAPWYLDGSPRRQRMMMMVPPSSVAPFEAWCVKKLACAAPILEVARSIGATPPDFDSDTDEVQIPCRVTTRQGETFDLAVLRFSRLPPIPWNDDQPRNQPRFRLVDEIASVEASRFALSRRVRRAFVVSRRPVVDRDWLSVVVVSRQGRRFRLSGNPLFFDRDGIAGEELRLASGSEGMSVPDMSRSQMTVFSADWFEHAKLLRIAENPVAALLSWLRWRAAGRAP